MASTTNELLKAALNSSRAPSRPVKSKSSSRQSSRRGTPKSHSLVASRDVSDDEYQDDTASVASDDTWVINNQEDIDDLVYDDWAERLKAAIDSLSETRRSSTREKTLATIVQLLSQVYAGESLESHRMSLLDQLRRSVGKKKGTKMESLLGLRGVALWHINFGLGSAEEGEGMVEWLKELATNGVLAGEIRAMAVSALGVVSFVQGGQDIWGSVDLCKFINERIFIQPDLQVLRQGLETFGLLLSVVGQGSSQQAETLFDQSFDQHLRALMADNVEVRVQAAQNFALVHDTLSNDTDLYEFDRQEEVIATLVMIKQETAKRHGKRDTHAQRGAVRDVLRTLETGELPQLKLTFGGKSVRFDDWTRIIRLHGFRNLLGGGLSRHFRENPLLRDVFGVEMEEVIEREEVGRRVVSPSSELAKMRTKEMRKKRQMAYKELEVYDE